MTTCDKTCLNKGYTLTLSAKDTEYGGIKVGARVYHVKDDISHQGTVVCLIKDIERYRYYSIHIKSSTVESSTFFHRQQKKLSTKAERHSFEIRVQ